MRVLLSFVLVIIGMYAEAQYNPYQTLFYRGKVIFSGEPTIKDTSLVFVDGTDTCLLYVSGDTIMSDCVIGFDGLWEAGSGIGAIQMIVDTSVYGPGSENDASGDLALALGSSTTASGNASTAWGGSSIASELLSTAWGASSMASELLSTAWGDSTISSGQTSTAWGEKTIASEYLSTAWGIKTKAKSYYETSLGGYNTDYTANDPNEWNANDRVLSVGIGFDTITPSNPIYRNAITALKSGRIGFTTDQPDAILHIADSTWHNTDTGLLNEKSSVFLDTVKINYGTPASGKVLQSNGATGASYWGHTIISDTATLDFPSVAANSIETLTMTLTGAQVGDGCTVGQPNISDIDDFVFNCRVSSANTVTVKAHKCCSGSVDLAAGLFQLTVIRKP